MNIVQEESQHILKKKQNERKQLYTLFFIIIIFIICNIPRVIISVHQVIIMEDIKYTNLDIFQIKKYTTFTWLASTLDYQEKGSPYGIAS